MEPTMPVLARRTMLAGAAASLAGAAAASRALAAASLDASTPPPAADEIVAGKMSALVGDPASPVIGDRRARVAIVEFFDYTCPYCKAAEPRLEALLRADKGVKLVLKEFPILSPESMVAARAGLAAAKQGKYAAYHQALMTYRGPLKASVIFDTAKAAGADVARLRRDMQSPAVSDEIIATFNLARSLRIFQTPGFIVGSHILTGPSAEIDFPKAVAMARARRA
jgi:protein-disulfide isomerase